MYDWIPDAWHAGYVQTNGIRLHYWRTGGDRPPVVLLHGITDNGLCWRRVAEKLAPTYDLIMVDGRGHGLSDKPEGDYALTHYAADTAGLIEHLALGKPAVVGHSLGAAIGATLASARPDLVHCLVLEDPPWRTPGTDEEEAARQAHMRNWRAETRQRKTEMSHAEIAAFGKTRSTTWHADEFEPWAQAKLDVSDRVFEGIDLTQWAPTVAKIQCPTLLICGEPVLGGVVTPEVAAQITAQNRAVRAIRLSDAGHNVRREQFTPYVEVVQDFLAQHMAPVISNA